MKKLLPGLLILAVLIVGCNSPEVLPEPEPDIIPNSMSDMDTEPVPPPPNLSGSEPFTLEDLTSWLHPVGENIWNLSEDLDITDDEIEFALMTNGNIALASDNRITVDLDNDGTLLHFHADVAVGDMCDVVPYLPRGIEFGEDILEVLMAFQVSSEEAILFAGDVLAGAIDDFDMIYIPIYGIQNIGSFGYVVAGYHTDGTLMLMLEYSLEVDDLIYVISYFFDEDGYLIGFCSGLFEAR